MKVYELIEKLNQCDFSAEVLIGDATLPVSEYDTVDSVYQVHHLDERQDVVALVTGRGLEVEG